jgi:tetratricopeptide (TPR) repeat protein
MFPKMMEFLPASDAEALSVSLKMVDEANIYIGIFAHRYGYIPAQNNGEQISISEIEYNRAVQRKIPRLIFIIDKNHPLAEFTIDDIETGEIAIKLKNFKTRLELENIVNFYKSPADLRAHVIHSLTNLRQPNTQNFHYVGDIPPLPKVFIAHPYTLLQSGRLIGRQKELTLLTNRVSKTDSEPYEAPILNIVAIGGMGKSALTWKWFNDIAPQEMSELAGRMWWSFYESDATFENFITRALSYVSQQPLEVVKNLTPSEQEIKLLYILNHNSFLIVMDGLERILIAYARMDATNIDEKQGELQRYFRKTADPRHGVFLKRLTFLKNSRILISTRLYPAILEEPGANSLGSFKHDLTGLNDEDAIELWRAFNITGSRDALLPIFNTFGKHPLLIQALAGEIKRYRPAPGNFKMWCKANQQFNPTKFTLLHEAMTHVLHFALHRLTERTLRTLRIIAAFRMPAQYDTIVALLIGEYAGKKVVIKNEQELDVVLTELEDRGLLGWDKRANRYDLHPIVRGVVWNEMGNDIRKGVYESLHTHFRAFPSVNDRNKIKKPEDILPAIELYNTLIGLKKYNDAFESYKKLLVSAPMYGVGTHRQKVELLELLFPMGTSKKPMLDNPQDQVFLFIEIGSSYKQLGQLDEAVSVLNKASDICVKHSQAKDVEILLNLANTFYLNGKLYDSQNLVRKALITARKLSNTAVEVFCLIMLGHNLGAQGFIKESGFALKRSLQISEINFLRQAEGIINQNRSALSLWLSEYSEALNYANEAWILAHHLKDEHDLIQSARLQGIAALNLNDLDKAEERLHFALRRARNINSVEGEYLALIGLSDLRRLQEDFKASYDFLEEIWELATRVHYPLFQADALNVLAQVEQDQGNKSAAISAAKKAYELSWCDGPPFEYHWGLNRARKILLELGSPPPSTINFFRFKYIPLSATEIDPIDKNYLG